MGMGDYDATEHERRERKSNHIDTEFDDDRTQFHGKIRHEGEESTEELLDQFNQINSD